MVTRAVSKLRQLEELQEELALPAEPLPAAPADSAGGASRGGGSSAALHRLRQVRHLGQPDPRRSLDLALTAIAEGATGSDSGSEGGGSEGGEGWGATAAAASSAKRQPAGSLRSSVAAPASVKRRRRSGGREEGEAGRLRRLQEQLQLSVAEVGRLPASCRIAARVVLSSAFQLLLAFFPPASCQLLACLLVAGMLRRTCCLLGPKGCGKNVEGAGFGSVESMQLVCGFVWACA
jgi:hypothetical protein